ncbi:hypothetical protein HDF11_001905 [Tunturiibacter psychrotolerans]
MSSKVERTWLFVLQILGSFLAYSLTHCWSAFLPLELLLWVAIASVHYFFKHLVTEYTTWLSDPSSPVDEQVVLSWLTKDIATSTPI